MTVALHPTLKVLLLFMGFLLSLCLSILLNDSTTIAQINPQVIPQIEAIEGAENVPPSYRLTISRPEDIVFASCPENYEATLSYLRNAPAIQCSPIQAQ
jgi:hypothetical protein